MALRIALLGDSRWRDQPGLLALRSALPPNAVILPYNLDIIKLYAPHVIVMNHVIGARNRRIAAWQKFENKGLVVVQPTEGRPNTDEQLEWWNRENEAELIDLYLAWSDRAPIDGVQTAVVGCPRFDVYNTPGAVYTRQEARLKWRIPQDARVLVCFSSFPQAKFSYAAQAFSRQDWKDLGIKDDPDQVASEEMALLREFRLTAEWLSQSFDVVVVKPHPMEDAAAWWQSSVIDHVISQEYVYNVIALGDEFFCRDVCTTVQDLWLSGKESKYVMHSPSPKPGPASEATTTDPNEYLHRYGYLPFGAVERTVAELMKLHVPQVRCTPDLPNLASALYQYTQTTLYPNPHATFNQGKDIMVYHK